MAQEKKYTEEDRFGDERALRAVGFSILRYRNPADREALIDSVANAAIRLLQHFNSLNSDDIKKPEGYDDDFPSPRTLFNLNRSAAYSYALEFTTEHGKFLSDLKQKLLIEEELNKLAAKIPEQDRRQRAPARMC